jgi:hypothetical protein
MPEKIKVIDIAREGTLLPPPKGTCPECARKHDPNMPHDAQSLYYQYKYYHDHGTWPGWKEAMAHCTEEVKKLWTEALKEMGIEV